MKAISRAMPVMRNHLAIDHLSGPLGFGEKWESLLKCVPCLHFTMLSFLTDRV